VIAPVGLNGGTARHRSPASLAESARNGVYDPIDSRSVRSGVVDVVAVRKPSVRSVSREAIVDMAQRLIQTKGHEQMSIQDVQNELGVSQGAIYHYFDSEAAPAADFASLPGVSEVAAEDYLLALRVLGSITPVVAAAAAAGVVDFLSREPSLEETFLAQYGRESAEVK
jgi:AcrR family transcriptional regulator